MTVKYLVPGVIAAFVVACATAPERPAPVPARAVPSATELLLQVRGAAFDAGDALDVQPLHDPAVEDLRQLAEAREAEGDFAGAAQALDQALALSPGAPGLMQARAEMLLAMGELDPAETLAWEAYESGPKLGPLCRRNWATVRLARDLRGDPAGAETAARQSERCATQPQIRM